MNGNSNNSDSGKTVTLLAFGHCVVDLYAGFITPILPVIATKLNISLPMAGFVIALSGLTSSFLQPIYGFFSDQISKRFFVVWGLIIATIFISLIGKANSYFELAIYILIGNLGVGLYHPQATAIVGKIKTLGTNIHMGYFVAGGIIGYALGPMLSALIVQYLSLDWTIIAAIPGIIIIIAIYFFLPKIEIEKQSFTVKNILDLLNSKKFLLIPIVLLVIIRSFMMVSYSVYLPFEWEDNLGYSVLTVGIVMTFVSVGSGLSSIWGGNFAEKYGEKKSLIISFIVPFPILITSLLILPVNGVLSFILYVIGVSLSMSTIAVNIVMAQRILPDNLGVSSGLTGGLCWGIAGLLIYPVGILIKMFDIYSVLIGITFLSFAALALVFAVPNDFYNDHQLQKK